ncbi:MULTISPECIES: thioesterase family protein [Bradyrhizobium]|jgi:fluoroacetyl-CoA thioesterase|uniref:thioesterase family protein n=1 Tax=Bradyrhizobium TaxID=374 RepID=UPI0004B5438E|nr:thioesterase family protein [Bradyrhizobium elkanii]MCS3520201.1 fluoroacetyl-CoA thioesterase [Bradyrhizobium elkanii]MCS4067856.1 fluoroacetyl-CoA thioesterase [Bradyrhizobium elkanii]MCS4083392.1 fluoroacetyl-CoA thioesterase [Bradyrhizobium elkanii]MCW2126981.1 fluoroacetyl-CoA thioesterase [Bradyrhizobium elkanii]MCW2173728.1 fluoroacetyl-CoA thioesterase [Bradyrhizobium elkanii]
MKLISTGTTGRFTLVVKPEHLANRFKDSILPPVLATPVMIMAMENAALNAVRSYLEPGESVVGTMVNVRHLAATAIGQTVTATAEVTAVEGRRIVFAISASDEIEEIGKGTHERMVVNLTRLQQRLDAKIARSEAIRTARR